MRLTLVFLLFSLSQAAFSQAYVLVLGTAQDGGFPHIGCQNECQLTFKDPSLRRNVVSLALVDPESKKWWLFEATPDMDEQLQLFSELTDRQYNYLPEGIFITHAHIGHYTGLMSLGREALGAKKVKVHVLPKLAKFLRKNGPWSQLVKLENIQLEVAKENAAIELASKLSVTVFRVPHRDEFSETAGFRINADKSYLFIPDIDKWSKWEKSIVQEVKSVDYAFLDGSFFADGELPNRSISEVPHPFVSETMALFANESTETRTKVHFIHFNHTNPILFDPNKQEEVLSAGFSIAEQGTSYPGQSLSSVSNGTVAQKSYKSEVLGREINYHIYLPKEYSADGDPFSLIYLLHGHGGDEKDWFQREEGNAAHLLDSLISSGETPPIVAVTLDAGNSWYVDGKEKMETAFLSEFMPLIEEEYNVSKNREQRLIAGNSAGGYGTLRFALKRPELFHSVILLSPAAYYPLPPTNSSSRKPETPAFSIDSVFSEALWKSHAYPTLLEEFRQSRVKPMFYISSGDDDRYNIVPVVTDLQQAFLENEVPNELRITNGGHTWDVWKKSFCETLVTIFRDRY